MDMVFSLIVALFTSILLLGVGIFIGSILGGVVGNYFTLTKYPFTTVFKETNIRSYPRPRAKTRGKPDFIKNIKKRK